MHILGINAYHPDSSACIIKDGQLIAAVEEERFRRIKHWAGLPEEAIKYCLKEANIELDNIDYIALNRNPRVNFYKKIIFVLLNRPSVHLVRNRLSNMLRVGAIKEDLKNKFVFSKSKINAKVYNIEHHRAHLASCFFVSPFEKAAVVSIDGFGDFTSCMIARGEDNKLDILSEVNYPHSLGIFYTAFTQFLGFNKFGDEYKVMGLSAYGKPRYTKKMEDILVLMPQGKFRLNLDYFSFYKITNSMTWDNCEPKFDNLFSEELKSIFGPVRQHQEELSDYHCDLAASLQETYERAFFHILNYAYKITGISKLCLAGGCALNSLANGKISDQTPFKEIYIQPASSDAGGSLGAAYYLYHQILGKKRTFIMKDAYWGPGLYETELKDELLARSKELESSKCIIKRIENKDELCSIAARAISEGRIVGWFQGRMEWGARALGNRSILADPRSPQIKDVLNARIKMREWFRPFAPSILSEKVGEYFEKDYPDPFMLKVYPARRDKQALIPAVTHVDGTGRLQTVDREENPLFWQLIKEFEKITTIPVLLNTSFNENEPIVCKPQEAIDCFLRTKMDLLVIGNVMISKTEGLA